MSWQDLVNNNLIGTGHVSKAAICGLDGSIWGKSDNFKLETLNIHSSKLTFLDSDVVLASGLRFEGEKYFVLQADNERIIGKKTANGFFIYKTDKAFIIGIYESGVQPEMCSKTTGALADYFKSINY
ncbi:Profilin [Meloidogyne graminicola]|uniref:Profilin n=1 Tax=Meloidogyne graminicola TaxID=189291 RepID=A0A8S9ZDW8_9BILA|nr:Profilin [Meloidogyne graminicola]